MKKLFESPVTTVILVVIAIIFAIFMFFKSCTHEVTYAGTVISHHTTSDKYGGISYYTIAKFDDGNIRSVDGLEYYVVEVGGTIYFTLTRLNK